MNRGVPSAELRVSRLTGARVGPQPPGGGRVGLKGVPAIRRRLELASAAGRVLTLQSSGNIRIHTGPNRSFQSSTASYIDGTTMIVFGIVFVLKPAEFDA